MAQSARGTTEDLGPWNGLLHPDQGIDRTKCSRVMPMKVINASYPRTGTASMQRALQILGYPTYHFGNILGNCRDADMWIPALQRKFGFGAARKTGPVADRTFFDKILGHVSATCDVPAALFWRELHEAYPDAKFILVERDMDAWQRSFDDLLQGLLDPTMTIVAYLDPVVGGRMSGAARAWVRAMLGAEDKRLGQAKGKDCYRKHYAKVRQEVPKEMLLEYRLGSGWEPLCEFLGKPVPDVPFPHLNEVKTLERSFGVFLKATTKRAALNIAIVVGFGAVVAQLARRFLL